MSDSVIIMSVCLVVALTAR